MKHLNAYLCHIVIGCTMFVCPFSHLLAEEISDSTLNLPSLTHKDSLVLQCDTLLVWADSIQPVMPHTQNYIRMLYRNVDFKDSTSANELTAVLSIVKDIHELQTVSIEAQQVLYSHGLAKKAQILLNNIYQRENIKILRKSIEDNTNPYLTIEQRSYLEELQDKLSKYFLATSNFKAVIEEIVSSRQNINTFSSQIDATLNFNARNENINAIPYMHNIYLELKTYLHQQPDGTYNTDLVEWDQIERLQIMIDNCRKK